jgi:hypothetical protein
MSFVSGPLLQKNEGIFTWRPELPDATRLSSVKSLRHALCSLQSCYRIIDRVAWVVSSDIVKSDFNPAACGAAPTWLTCHVSGPAAPAAVQSFPGVCVA